MMPDGCLIIVMRFVLRMNLRCYPIGSQLEALGGVELAVKVGTSTREVWVASGASATGEGDAGGQEEENERGAHHQRESAGWVCHGIAPVEAHREFKWGGEG
jgi:hypothetical protein